MLAVTPLFLNRSCPRRDRFSSNRVAIRSVEAELSRDRLGQSPTSFRIDRYKSQPPWPLEQVEADIRAVEREILGRLGEMAG